jgi:integrase
MLGRRIVARQSGKLKALGLDRKAPGRYGDGGGLYLLVDKAGARRWLFRFRWKDNRAEKGSGRLRDMGLGNLGSVPLAKARELAAQCRGDLADGLDPIARREARQALKKGVPTFGRCADELVDALEAGWRNEKHRHQWRHTLTEYAAAIRPRPVDKVTTEDVLSVVQPIWQTKPETASRLRGRIEAVLDAARARGHIPQNTANPARWRGHLDKLLPKRKKLTRGHHPAMPFADVPTFIEHLRKREAIAALALEFIILTAARSGEALGARWQEIDMKEKVWTLPDRRMKRGVEHRVPLSPRAIEILEAMAKGARGDLVFSTHRADRPMSGMACTMLLRRMKAEGVTVHGFRSSFRDWAGECTSFPREIAEAALAHAVGNEVERAYRRSDALEKRRKLMDAWASYCTKSQSGKVVQLRR